jgi:hypothetical protein
MRPLREIASHMDEDEVDRLLIPDDAGPYRAGLLSVMLRIPEGWGRWISCEAGWYPLITRLDSELAALDPRYVVHQVKEKYGALRFYAETSNALVWDRFDALINAAETRSATVCERCSSDGELVRLASGWCKTLCPTCADRFGLR